MSEERQENDERGILGAGRYSTEVSIQALETSRDRRATGPRITVHRWVAKANGKLLTVVRFADARGHVPRKRERS